MMWSPDHWVCLIMLWIQLIPNQLLPWKPLESPWFDTEKISQFDSWRFHFSWILFNCLIISIWDCQCVLRLLDRSVFKQTVRNLLSAFKIQYARLNGRILLKPHFNADSLGVVGVWKLPDQACSEFCVLSLIRSRSCSSSCWLYSVFSNRRGVQGLIKKSSISPAATVHWSSRSVNMGRWTLHSILFLVLFSNAKRLTLSRYVSVFCCHQDSLHLCSFNCTNDVLFSVESSDPLTGMCLQWYTQFQSSVSDSGSHSFFFPNLPLRFTSIDTYWRLHE